MKKRMSKLMVGMGVLGAVAVAQASLIASEGFSTTADGAGGTYYNNKTLGDAVSGTPNNVVVVGNSGFNTANSWVNSTTIKASTITTLGHSGTVGTTYAGSAYYNGSSTRNENRLLAATPTTASSYYMSGLFKAGTAIGNGDQVIMGMMKDSLTQNTSSYATGFHLGMQKRADKLYLAAFAGGMAYELADVTGSTGTFQIVLKLDVNASGNETLTAWYATNNATALTQGRAATDVGDIWQDAGDLDTFAVQLTAGGTATTVQLFGDEMRFGTTLGDVTATTIPEPTTLGLFVISACSMFFIRRIQH